MLRLVAITMVASVICATRVSAQCSILEEIAASDGDMFDGFGTSVAIHDGVVVVGAPTDDTLSGETGTAYIFRLVSGQWAEEQKLQSGDLLDRYDRFGDSVAVTDNVIVIGAPFHDVVGLDSGAAYVYRFDGSVWNLDQELIASDSDDNDWFGSAVAASGDRIAIGSQLDEDGAWVGGAVYTYLFDGTRWIEEQKIIASSPGAEDRFGYSVALDGNTMIVGAISDDDAGPAVGSASIFNFNGTRWVETQLLTPRNPASDRYFGYRVAISGELAVIGMESENGGAYAFRFDGVRWNEEQRLSAGGTLIDDGFGESVAVDDSNIVIGAPRADSFGRTRVGATYVFRFDGSVWNERQKLNSENPRGNERFGESVSVEDGVLIVGIPSRGGDARGGAVISDITLASWATYGSGWPGANGIPSLTSQDNPILGTTITLDIENSFAQDTLGILLIGLQEQSVRTRLDGTLLVLPYSVLPIPIPALGLSISGGIPAYFGLCGVSVFLQCLEVDPGASQGVSFTPGLELVLGS